MHKLWLNKHSLKETDDIVEDSNYKRPWHESEDGIESKEEVFMETRKKIKVTSQPAIKVGSKKCAGAKVG